MNERPVQAIESITRAEINPTTRTVLLRRGWNTEKGVPVICVTEIPIDQVDEASILLSIEEHQVGTERVMVTEAGAEMLSQIEQAMTIFKVGDTVLSDPESRKEIGSGAEGVAYLCQGLVIKEINKNVIGESLRQRLITMEALREVAREGFPDIIVPLQYGYWERNGVGYEIMEYTPGHHLRGLFDVNPFKLYHILTQDNQLETAFGDHVVSLTGIPLHDLRYPRNTLVDENRNGTVVIDQ